MTRAPLLALAFLGLAGAVHAQSDTQFDLDCAVTRTITFTSAGEAPDVKPPRSERQYYKVDLTARLWCEVKGSSDATPLCPPPDASNNDPSDDEGATWGYLEPAPDDPAWMLHHLSWRGTHIEGDWWLLESLATANDTAHEGINLKTLAYAQHTKSGPPDDIIDTLAHGTCRKLPWTNATFAAGSSGLKPVDAATRARYEAERKAQDPATLQAAWDAAKPLAADLDALPAPPP